MRKLNGAMIVTNTGSIYEAQKSLRHGTYRTTEKSYADLIATKRLHSGNPQGQLGCLGFSEPRWLRLAGFSLWPERGAGTRWNKLGGQSTLGRTPPLQIADFEPSSLLPAPTTLSTKSQNRSLTFPSIQLHSVTLTCGSLIDHEDFKAHSLRVRLLRNKWVC